MAANWIRSLFCKPTTPKKTATFRKARRLFVEQLEERALMTTASLSAGVLRIEGTAAADTIQLRQVAGIITVDGVFNLFSASQVNQIRIDAGDGNDTIRVDSEILSFNEPITAQTFIYGGKGLDYICGGQGINVIFGEGDRDQIWGNINDDLLDGGAGNDDLVGDGGNDDLYGDLGADQIWGEGGDDFMVGGDGADYLDGGSGGDKVDGGRGTDELWGGANNDIFKDDTGYVVQDKQTGDQKLTGHHGWFDMNLTNAAVRSYARAVWFDREISRVDVLDLCNEVVRADNVVSSTELTDLRKLGSSGTNAGMPEYVRNLLGKVAGSNPANAKFQGGNLGNLFNGSTGAHLGKLIDKWFLGKDVPTAKDASGTTYQYQVAKGTLFGNSASSVPTMTDVRQGVVGDCYFLAALGETALRRPEVISGMFILNDDGDTVVTNDTWTVRFFKNGVADYVTVDRQLPARGDKTLPFADVTGTGSRGKVDGVANKLWVALAEKAYVQLNESGGLGQESATNKYMSIDLGFSDVALAHVTGKQTSFSTSLSFTTAVSNWNAGKLLLLDTKASGTAADIVPGHTYVVWMVTVPASGTATTANTTFKLFNPWGLAGGKLKATDTVIRKGTLDLTWSQIQANFFDVVVGN